MIYKQIVSAQLQQQKLFSILIDPDKCNESQLKRIVNDAMQSGVDFFFVGSSILTQNNFKNCIRVLKEYSNIPVVLFPGNMFQISGAADALLFLSLLSGRNPDLLIGHHVMAAPAIKALHLETIATAYLLIDPGHPTSVSYMSNTSPIPYDKPDIAYSTAMAAEMLGLKLIYLDAGSGARHSLSAAMVKAVRSAVNIPIIAGGGIKTPEKALELCIAGADVIVVGNAIEKEINIIADISAAIHSYQTT